MVPRIILTGYHILDCIHFFTAGADEVRAWTIRRGATAPRAAAAIHSDFEKFFISCDQYTFEDFKQYGSESAIKAAGKYRSQGKAYIVQDGDILFIKHNARR